MCLFLLFPLLSKLLRARSPSAAAWLTCPRWSRRRTSWRSPSWCRRNNATREKKLKEPTQLNPARRGRRTLEMLQASWRKQHSGGKKAFTKWFYGHSGLDLDLFLINVLIQFAWLSREWGLRSTFRCFQTQEICTTATSWSVEDYCPVWALSWHALCRVCAIMSLSIACLCPCLPISPRSWWMLPHLHGPGSWAKG